MGKQPIRFLNLISLLTQSLGAKGKVSFNDNVYWKYDDLQIGSGMAIKNITDPSEQNIALWESRGYGCQRKLSDPGPEAYFNMDKSSGTAQMT